MIDLSFSTIWLPIILTLPMLLIFTAKDVLGVIFATALTTPIALFAWILYGIFK